MAGRGIINHDSAVSITCRYILGNRVWPMTKGLVFDIREFAVHDGPGLRTTVFMKGCPLACMWCHNPEGQSAKPEVIQSLAGSRVTGTKYSSSDLAAILNRQAAIFEANEGGVTFSGGEPLMQADFVAEVIDLLDGIHVLLDTSGYARPADFFILLERVNLVYYDLKLIDPVVHTHYTRCDNALVLHNLDLLASSGAPFVIRVPLVPGATDTEKNLTAIATTVHDLPGLLQVDLLLYNRQAGAKYPALGKIFQPDYDETQPVHTNVAIFEELGIEARTMDRDDVADTLERVPGLPPRTFSEALQSLRLMHAVVWLSGHYHVGLGRFDQYMWPYLKADLDSGQLDETRAFDLLAEFFISLNKDSDLYPGVQQGDNGQTITLGGVDRQGNLAVNPLTYMVLRVSRDVAMIDPKGGRLPTVFKRLSGHSWFDRSRLSIGRCA